MKRNLLAAFAVVLAIAFSAFTTQNVHKVVKKSKFIADPHYFQLKSGATVETLITNYDDLGTTEPSVCPSSSKLCWFRVDDMDQDGDIDGSDFTASFNAIDNHYNGTVTGSLDDEDEVADLIDKRAN